MYNIYIYNIQDHFYKQNSNNIPLNFFRGRKDKLNIQKTYGNNGYYILEKSCEI